MTWIRRTAVVAALLGVAVPVARAGRDVRVLPRAAPSALPSPSPSTSLVVTLSSQPPVVPEPDPAAAKTLLAATNAERKRRGLATLRWWPAGLPVAQAHTQAMLNEGRIFHNPQLDALVRSLGVRALGENVGIGPSIAMVESAFMRSREHRDNILDPSYRLIAIWVIRDERGFVWVTVNFATPR